MENPALFPMGTKPALCKSSNLPMQLIRKRCDRLFCFLLQLNSERAYRFLKLAWELKTNLLLCSNWLSFPVCVVFCLLLV